jgi:hypothetical protein
MHLKKILMFVFSAKKIRDAAVLCFRFHHITIVFVTARDEIFEKKRELFCVFRAEGSSALIQAAILLFSLRLSMKSLEKKGAADAEGAAYTHTHTYKKPPTGTKGSSCPASSTSACFFLHLIQ